MSKPFIEIVKTVAVDYKAHDGQTWGAERDAQNYNAELAMIRILGPRLMKSYQTSVYNNIRNLSGRLPSPDVLVLRSLMDNYLNNILPAFMGLNGKFQYGTGSQIKTEDGRTFDNRHKAALHVLELEFQRLWESDKISVEGRRAITNTNKYTPVDSPAFKQQCTRFQFLSNLGSFFKMTDDDGRPYKGYEQRFRDALQAIVIERSKPIEGVKRPA